MRKALCYKSQNVRIRSILGQEMHLISGVIIEDEREVYSVNSRHVDGFGFGTSPLPGITVETNPQGKGR